MGLFATLCLALVNRKDAVADMLASHLHEIAAPLPRIERQCKRQAGPAPRNPGTGAEPVRLIP
jgi:hypothetical protein